MTVPSLAIGMFHQGCQRSLPLVPQIQQQCGSSTLFLPSQIPLSYANEGPVPP